MLKGFEDITQELRPYELDVVLPIIISKVCHHKGKSNAIKNEALRQYIFDRTQRPIAEPRIRKIVEYIRQTKLLENLIAGRFGYFIADSPEELKEWLEVMKQRRNALNASIIAGEVSYKQMTGLTQSNQHKKRQPTPGAKQEFLFSNM